MTPNVALVQNAIELRYDAWSWRVAPAGGRLFLVHPRAIGVRHREPTDFVELSELTDTNSRPRAAALRSVRRQTARHHPFRDHPMSTRSLALLLASLSFASPADAQMTLVSQDRRIEVSARATPGGIPQGPSVHNTVTVVATDAGPFDELRTVSAQTSDSSANATAEIHSLLAADRIVWSGRGTAGAFANSNIPARGTGDARSNTVVEFSLAETCTYTLDGSMMSTNTAWGSAHVWLLRGTTLVVVEQQSSPGTRPVHVSGVLAPGSYRLELAAPGYSSHGYDYVVDCDTNLQIEFRVAPLHAPYCFGDGTGGGCPCGNASAPGSDAGCLSSVGLGGTLRATGTASLSNDTFVLQGSQMTNGTALYFQGTAEDFGSPFGDGLRCVAGTVARLGTRTNSGGSSQYPIGAEPSVSVRGAVAAPGVRTYQVWYRNVAAFCTPEGFNLTNGLRVQWVN